MPPWKSVPSDGRFIGQPPLKASSIDTLKRWVAEGMPEGDPRELPPRPTVSTGWQLGQPDLILTPEETYLVPADGPDRLRVFVLRIPIDRPRYVKGLEFRPGNNRVVHHANILVDRTSTSREVNDRDPERGAEGLMSRTAEYPSGHLLGWTPGLPDPLLPDGLAWMLVPGSDLVVQLHLLPSGKPEPVPFSVGLFFSAEPPTATPAVLRLGRQNIDIPAGDRAYKTEDTYVLPVDVQVMALKAHAHYRARRVAAEATLPDGKTVNLLTIDDWDFRWQHTYRYVTPPLLPKGTQLKLTMTYDNSDDNPRNPVRPSQRVLWGPRSSDEMGDLWIQVLPKSSEELTLLNLDFRTKWAAEDLQGLELRLGQAPNSTSLHNDAGLLNLELGRPDAALAQFEASLRETPDSAEAHLNVGIALMAGRRYNDAVRAYERALAINPKYPEAHTNLGNALASLGRDAEALEHYQEALRLHPDHATAHNNVASMLMGRGDLQAAITHLNEALRIDPQLADAQFNLGLVRTIVGPPSQAISHLTRAVEIRPNWIAALTELAWMLSTSPDTSLRDPARAVQLGERAMALVSRPDMHVLDVLAAALASNGQFDRARRTIEAAIRLNPEAARAAGLIDRQRLYEEGRSYLGTAPPPR
jgi:tetratricopeptide (TPR) repeat protein